MPIHIRVLLVDDHVMVRTGLRRILEVDAGLTVVGEASDAEGALHLLSLGTPCDVAVVDLSLPDHDGAWLARAIQARFPSVRVLLLGMQDDAILVGLRAGANGYLPKTATARDLVSAIDHVYHDGAYLHPALATAAVRAAHPVTGPLTARERDILSRAARGRTNQEISEDLGLSLSVVKQCLRRLYRRLNASTRTEAIVRALEEGLIVQ